MTDKQSLSELAEHYSKLAQYLTQNKDSPDPDQVLDCLLSRDRIAYLLTREGPAEPSTACLVVGGDHHLKAIAEPISQMAELKQWRKSFSPSAEAWWWPSPPPKKPSSFLERFDWLWTALALTFLTVALGLVADISPRFLSGGSDTWGGLAVVIQSALALLTTSSILTKTGQDAAKRILNSLKFPRRFWEEAGVTAAGLLLILLFIFRLSLPQIAVSYNDSGLENHCAGRLSSAQFDYNRALKLNPDYPEAHFNLGLLYEELQDVEQARTQYQIVVQGGLVAAHNNLAHLDILDENYAAAIPLLLTGLQRIETKEIKDELVRCQPISGLTGRSVVADAPVELLQYDMLKNLGWARLGQERYDEAGVNLQAAIDLIADKAPAYCLRAQVREGQEDPDGALKDWETCLQYASSYNADEDVWIGLARQRFQTETNTEGDNQDDTNSPDSE